MEGKSNAPSKVQSKEQVQDPGPPVANEDPPPDDHHEMVRKSTHIPENLRRRRCHLNPTCGCVLENTIYVTVLLGMLIDFLCIIFWAYLLSIHDSVWNFHFARESNVQMLVMHCFCLLFNVVLFFGTTMENVLLCLSWIVMRGIWYFTTLIAWIRSSDVLLFDKELTEDNILAPEEKIFWLLAFWAYWPIMVLYGWFTLIVIVFICRLITISERKRLMVRQVQGIPFTDVNPARISILPPSNSFP